MGIVVMGLLLAVENVYYEDSVVASSACERSKRFTYVCLLGSIPNPLDISDGNGCAAERRKYRREILNEQIVILFSPVVVASLAK